MNIVVCVKQIPDPAAPQSLDASHNLDRSGKLILDEADTYGVEMALQLVDKAGTGEVTVVSMGSAADVAGLRNALAMGAAKAVIVSDESLRGTDALGTAKVLAAVIGRISPDLVLCATESSDGYTGTTPAVTVTRAGKGAVTSS
jgi:electron transfer flavoprotein beta subunit